MTADRSDGMVRYVGFGGHRKALPITGNLGVTARTPTPFRHGRGVRQAIYDIAFGIVNGFPASAILYYVLTRSLSKRVWNATLRWEMRTGRYKSDIGFRAPQEDA